MSSNSAKKKDSRDDTIIALLDILGQRMLDSEGEREEMRVTVESLVEAAGNNEQGLLSLQHKLNKNEANSKTVYQRQKELEERLDEQIDKIDRAVAMTDKIEEAMAQQARINRRLDKLVQDKTRMIGKLDRIEETVIETQEALHTNAMVMLSGREDGSHIPVDPDSGKDQEQALPWWSRTFSAHNAGIAAMIALAVFCGWGLSKIPYSDLASSYSKQTTIGVDNNKTAAAEQQSFDQVLADIAPVKGPTRNDTMTEDMASAVDIKATTTAATSETVDDVGAPGNGMNIIKENSDAELAAQMDEDPASLAAALNEIEPGQGATTADSDMQETARTAKTESVAELNESDKTAPAKITEASLPATPSATEAQPKEPNVDAFLTAQTPEGALRSRIKPDTDLPDTIKLIEDKAFEGIPEAQHDLAAIYTAGHGGVAVDYNKAAAWFREAALGNVANAQYNLGVLYHQGLGVKQNIDTAFGWYRAAAREGHPEAQYNLGIAYIEGIGSPYDPAKAANYFKNAAQAGILEAAYNLGLIYENGLLGSAQPGEALKWYKLAADLGSAEGKAALNQLAKIMEIDPEGVQAYTVTPQKSGSNSQSSMPAYLNEGQNAPAQKRTAIDKPREEEPTQTAVAPQGTAAAPSNSNILSVGTLRPEDVIQDINPMAKDGSDIVKTFPTVPESALKDVSDNMQKDQATLAQIQEQLMRVGLYPGPADGLMGSMTEDAIKSYQEMYELPQTGQASEALLVHMLAGELGNSLPQYGSREE